jgi:hypothetical protein
MKRFLLILVAIFIGIQFVRPVKNLSDQAPGPDHLAVLYPPPPGVKAIFERACYDCHTNNTRYPWYAHVQPAAWWLNDHIEEGKKHFNFEEFGSYSTKRQLHKLEELIEEVEEDKMPLPSYRRIHSEARLTPDEVNSLITWTASVRKQIKQP